MLIKYAGLEGGNQVCPGKIMLAQQQIKLQESVPDVIKDLRER